MEIALWILAKNFYINVVLEIRTRTEWWVLYARFLPPRRSSRTEKSEGEADENEGPE